MIGDMLSKIRKEKRITKTKLAELTDINIGHLTHIEKGERNPSHKALKSICNALEIPYQELLYTYDKELSNEQIEYDYINYIPYNKIPAFSNLDSFVECPAKFANASFAYKVPDSTMDPVLKEGTYVYVEQNALLNNKDIGLFFYNGEFLTRYLLYKKDKFVLKARDKDVKDITISKNDTFYVIGRIYL